MSSHRGRSRCSRVVRSFIPPAALAALTAMMLGCSDDGTTTAFQPPDPSFHHNPGHGGGPGGGDGGGDTGPALQFDLMDPAGVAGVYSDALGPYPSTMLDDAGGLHPTCDVRHFELKDVVSPGVISQSEMDDIIANQSTCDGATGGSDPRRAFLKAPGILTLTEDCDSDPNTATADCPFDTYPSYEWKGNRIKATGMFSNAARHIEVDQVTSNLLTWLFQDPKVTIVTRDAAGAPTSWRFEATTIHLYGHPLSQLCVPASDFDGDGDLDTDDADPDRNNPGPENCLPFALSADFTLEPEGP